MANVRFLTEDSQQTFGGFPYTLLVSCVNHAVLFRGSTFSDDPPTFSLERGSNFKPKVAGTTVT